MKYFNRMKKGEHKNANANAVKTQNQTFCINNLFLLLEMSQFRPIWDHLCQTLSSGLWLRDRQGLQSRQTQKTTSYN